MSWKHHKSKDKKIIGSDKLITNDITVENLVKTQGINSDYFDGRGVLKTINVIDSGSDFNVTSSKGLVEFLRNNTLASFGSDPCGHFFRTNILDDTCGNIIFPSLDFITYPHPKEGKGWKIGAYNSSHIKIENGEGILEFISDVSFAKNMYLGGGICSETINVNFINTYNNDTNYITFKNDVSFDLNVTICGDLIVEDASFTNIDSFNGKEVNILSDASFHKNVDISLNLQVDGEVSFNNLLRVPDASFINIDSLTGNELNILSDASFQKKVEISDNLTVTQGEVSFNNLLRVPDASFNKIGGLVNNTFDVISDVSFLNIVDICNHLNAQHVSFTNIDSLNGIELNILSDVSFHKNVDISLNLVVEKTLKVPDTSFDNIDSFNENELNIISDASFHKNVNISDDLVVNGEVSFNNLLRVPDASFTRMDSLIEGNNLIVSSDVSFENDVNITGSLTVDGSFRFNEIIYNKKIESIEVSNIVIVSTLFEISNNATGHALKVTQYGDNTDDKYDVALFMHSEDNSAVEIIHDGKTIFYEDVSFNKNIDVSGHLHGLDASFRNNVEISNNLVVNGNISLNSNFNLLNDASFMGNVDICNGVLKLHDACINTIFGTAITPSYYQSDNSNILIIEGDLSVNGEIITEDKTAMELIDIFNDKSPSNLTEKFWLAEVDISNLKINDFLIHEIKVSGKIEDSNNFTWDTSGHWWELSRHHDSSDNSDLNYGNSYWIDSQGKHFHAFNRVEQNEEVTFSFTEKLTNSSAKHYKYWRCDFSGAGGKLDNSNKLTWKITKFMSNPKFISNQTSQLNVGTINSINGDPNIPIKFTNKIEFDTGIEDDSIDVEGDIFVNGKITALNIIGGGGGGGGAGNFYGVKIHTKTLFDNCSNNVDNSWNYNVEGDSFLTSLNTNMKLLHNIKVTGFIDTSNGLTSNDHTFNITRKHKHTQIIDEVESFKHIFSSINNHEQVNYSFIEDINSNHFPEYLQLDFSGTSAKLNSDDTLTWKITLLDQFSNYAPTSVGYETIFDNSANVTNGVLTPWQNLNKEVSVKKGDIVSHYIKVSGFIDPNYNIQSNDDFHRWILTRKIKFDNSFNWDSSSTGILKHTFTTIQHHEEDTFYFTEKINKDAIYDGWKCEFLGPNALNDASDNLTWNINILHPESGYILTDNSHAEIPDISINSIGVTKGFSNITIVSDTTFTGTTNT